MTTTAMTMPARPAEMIAVFVVSRPELENMGGGKRRVRGGECGGRRKNGGKEGGKCREVKKRCEVKQSGSKAACTIGVSNDL